MRPLTLKISGFGPYCNETIIDFEKLGTHGIYIITGDTGAGKTTIFDAITFALYGEASGEQRDAGMLRSKYADENTETYVELKFDYAGKIYIIRRNPRYEKKKSRGNGVTSKNADATLMLSDGTVICSGVKNADEKINDIIGLDAVQFKQIALIAQGDFLRLLNAKTEERQKIFRDIFKTDIFNRFQDMLSEKTKEEKAKYDNINSNIRSFIDGLSCDDSFKNELISMTGFEDCYDKIEQIKDFIEKDSEERKVINKEREDIDKKLFEANKALTIAEELEKTRNEIAEKKIELEALKPECEMLELDFNLKKENLKSVDKLMEQIAIIKGKIADYDEYEKKRNEMESLNESLAISSNKKEKVENDIDLKKRELENAIKNAEMLAGSGEEKLRMEHEKATQIERRKKLKSIKNDILSFNESKHNCYAKQDVYIRTQKRADAYQSEAIRLRKIYNMEIAGTLAQNLVEGEKCPVCGSLHHPEIAHRNENAPTLEKVEEVESIAENERNNAIKASENASKYRGIYEEKEKKLKETFSENELKGDLNSINKMIIEQMDECDKIVKALSCSIPHKENDEKRREEYLKEIENLRNLIETKTAQLNEIKNGIASESEKMSLYKQECEKLKANLEFSDKNAALKGLSELENKKKQINSEYENAEKSLKSEQEKVHTLEAGIATLENSVKNSADVDVEKLRNDKTKFETVTRQLQDKLSALTSKIEINSHMYAKIKESLNELIIASKRYSYIKSLDDTTKGKLSEREKVTLETFVQSTYFDRIIARANKQFLKMSGGRYELKRAETGESKQVKSGLDLCVVDHFNTNNSNDVRSVKTLSGGESFIASLSLALGLSEEIQSSSGGIQLDTMFVDEGFGSLDNETLDHAVRALKGLSDENRLVGIISHVTELADKIDKKMIVTKQKDGSSRVKIEV